MWRTVASGTRTSGIPSSIRPGAEVAILRGRRRKALVEAGQGDEAVARDSARFAVARNGAAGRGVERVSTACDAAAHESRG